MNHLVVKLVIRWLTLICPEHYREAMIGDLLEFFEFEHTNDHRTAPIKLLWQVVISTPSILVMRTRASHSQLNRQIICSMLTIGLSTLLLERFVFVSAVWNAAQAWSIQSIFMLRFIYLVASIAPIVCLCLLLSFWPKFKASLQSIFAEPVFSLYTILCCFSFTWFDLLTHFSFDLLAFRLIQFCSAYICMRWTINNSHKARSLL